MSLITKSGSKLRFEVLESRTMLDGNLSAAVINGTAFLQGDNLANGVAITAGARAGQFVVTGTAVNSATRINGQTGPVTLSGVTRDLVIDLGAGNNSIRLAGLNTPRAVSIAAGIGNDTVVLDGPLTVNGNLRINTNSGLDSLRVDHVTVTGNADVTVGFNSNKVVTVEELAVVGRFFFSGGSGNAQITFSPRSVETEVVFSAGIEFGLIADSAVILTAAGNDSITIVDSIINNNLFVAAGLGNDTLSIDHSTVRFDAGFDLSQGGNKTVIIDSLNVANRFTLVTGSGSDTVTISPQAFQRRPTLFSQIVTVPDFGINAANSFTLVTGAGVDRVTAFRSTVLNTLLIDLGAGNDLLNFQGNTIGGTMTLQGGLGSNLLNRSVQTANVALQRFILNFTLTDVFPT